MQDYAADIAIVCNASLYLFISFSENAVTSSVRRKFSGGVIQWHIVVICIWSALFVTSKFEVIFMFPIQRFGEVCW